MTNVWPRENRPSRSTIARDCVIRDAVIKYASHPILNAYLHWNASPEKRPRRASSAFGERHGRFSLIDYRLLPVTDQHIAAGRTKLWAIFLEASQDSKIAPIHQLAAEALHVASASLLVLIGPAVSEGANGNRDIQQEKCHQELVHCVSSFRFRATSAIVSHAAVHSITIAWSFPSADGALRSSRTSGIAASERIIINLKSSI